MGEPGAGRGRPRQAGTDERVAAAALALLRSGGPAAVTMEAVAAASGVAKTTIYRRHANRAALLDAVLRGAIGVPDLPPDGSARDKLRFSLEQAWRQMSDILGPGGLAAIVADADPAFTELFRDALRPYDDALAARLRDDARAGRVRADVDAEGVVSLLLGAWLGELVRRGRVDGAWLDRSLDLLWPVLDPERA
ncbi:TetR/AcrR family transcriptional regulator [Nocardioides abyssi]|uniref:TetR/AcrR family transcriptional regulator n=1 Tax=Nocardioides abyssi TaxID=3058370 RepID=A0ABT8ESH3_9ACTN|nr:TetR/AcrR family transcriptional regulator [Nocardioides abyssi]MDN4161069.1 TetR/AcrR family transcriptional regulator [Nocardioides abyssi]